MLNRHARNAVAELSTYYGITDLTADEIVRLHVLGERFDAAIQTAGIVCSAIPVAVGNVVLYPLTCAAADFVDGALVALPPASRARLFVLPFALANSRNAAELEFNNARELDRRLRRWGRSVTATLNELDTACERVLDVVLDLDREEARNALNVLVSWLDGRDAELATSVRERCGAELEQAETEAGGGKDAEAGAAEYRRWERYCVELAALTGVSAADWYARDRRLVVHACAVALEAMSMQAGMSLGGGGSPRREEMTPKQKAALKELRNFMAEIVKNRRQHDGQ